MIRKYVRPRQPDFVTPPHSTHHAAQASTGTAQHKHWQTLFSYKPATAVAVLAEKIATKLLAAATKSLPVQIQNHPPLFTLLRMALPSALNSTKFVTLVLLSNSRHSEPALRMCQLRRRYDHATNATLLRYKSLFPRYEKSSMPLSERRAHPSNILTPSHDDIRQPLPIPEVPRSGTVWSQYEPATAVERMELFSDTNNVLTDTDRVPPPIWRGTLPHPNSRPIHLNHHDETRTHRNVSRHAALPARLSCVSRRAVGDDVYCDRPHL